MAVSEDRRRDPRLERFLVLPSGDDQPPVAPVGWRQQLEALETVFGVDGAHPGLRIADELISGGLGHAECVDPDNCHGSDLIRSEGDKLVAELPGEPGRQEAGDILGRLRPVLLIQLIIGSTRPGRFADKPVAWLVDRLSQRDDFDLEILDLRDHPLAFYDHALPPARAQRDYPSEDVARFGRAIDRADGFIIVTSEYNHGYPASLKNAMDHVFPEFNRKPVTFVGYGNVGGARAIEQLRLVCVEFEMAPLRHAVHILPELMMAARQADAFTPEVFASLDQRLETAVADLLWWTAALAARRASPSLG